jgi:hypothetical protein
VLDMAGQVNMHQDVLQDANALLVKAQPLINPLLKDFKAASPPFKS